MRASTNMLRALGKPAACRVTVQHRWPSAAQPRVCTISRMHVRTLASRGESAVAVLADDRKAVSKERTREEAGKAREPGRRPGGQKPKTDFVEVYKLGKIALPLLLQYMIGSSSHLINTSFVGHLSDPVLLSSMVLATSLSMATGYTVMNGVASASETLCGQANGAKNYKAMQDTLLRALLITGLTCIPISLAWTHSESILVALGQPEAIAHGAARYLQLTLPALYMYSIHECVDKYLLSQRVVKPSLAITAATTALTPLFAWWFVVQQNMGLEGAAYAYVAVQACTTSLGLGYLAYRELVKLPSDPPPGWTPLRPSAGALAGWTPYLALAVPAVLSYCMEGWATEVLIFLSGILDNADVAVGVTGLALQFSTIVWLAAASIGSATSTRVANKLGQGDAAGARATAQTAVRCVLASQTLIGAAAYTFREPLLGLMTNNSEVISLSMQVMPVLACCFVADGLNAVQGAVLRGAGRQWWTAGLNIAGWWGVGVPLAYYLAVVQGHNVPGLWAGFATASALQSGLQYLAVTRGIDWDNEVQRAKTMMEASSRSPESSTESMDEPGVNAHAAAMTTESNRRESEPGSTIDVTAVTVTSQKAADSSTASRQPAATPAPGKQAVAAPGTVGTSTKQGPLVARVGAMQMSVTRRLRGAVAPLANALHSLKASLTSH